MENTPKTIDDMFNRRSLSEQVEDALREEISTGRVAPGERVNVSEFQKNWHVSSTPFRDALKALEAQGFVTIEPRKGVYVAPMNLETLGEIFDLRIALECMAVELATPRIPQERIDALIEVQESLAEQVAHGDYSGFVQEDTLVHDLAREFCGNTKIQKLLVSQRDLFRWAQHTIIAEIPHSYALALPEHRTIANAYLSRSAKRAAKAMRDHLEKSRDRLISQRGQ